jgi:hypothetical protein
MGISEKRGDGWLTDGVVGRFRKRFNFSGFAHAFELPPENHVETKSFWDGISLGTFGVDNEWRAWSVCVRAWE